MNKKKIGLICLCIVLPIAGFAIGKINRVQLSKGQEVVASVSGKKITAEDLFNELKNQGGSTVLVNMIDEYIVSKEIKDDSSAIESAKSQLEQYKEQYKSYGQDFSTVLTNAGYENENAFLKVLTLQEKKSEVVKKYLGEELTDDEIKKYYDENIYGNMSAKHILITPDVTDDMTDDQKSAKEEEALKTAKEVIEKLNNGSKFDDLVKEYSEDEGSKENNGLIENFTKGDVVDSFFDSSLSLKVNEYTKEPVKSEYGYHIILKTKQDKKPSLEDSKDDIIDKLVENKLSEDTTLSDSTWVNVRKKYKLNIKDTDLKNAYNKLITK